MELTSQNPFEQFGLWLSEAEDSEINDPNGMALATSDKSGQPSVRMVLLKGYDERGFVFYTNLESDKGRDLLENPKAGLLFHWKSKRRQIRVEGSVEPVSAEEADDYYHSRSRGSQIGAWASQQSRPLESRYALEKNVAKYTAKFGISTIPRPEHWNGFRLIPNHIEFWQDGKFRLHDRFSFTRAETSDAWNIDRLYP